MELDFMKFHIPSETTGFRPSPEGRFDWGRCLHPALAEALEDARDCLEETISIYVHPIRAGINRLSRPLRWETEINCWGVAGRG